MTPQNKQKVQTIAEILDNAREHALEVAGNEPEFAVLKLRIDKQLKTLSNSVKFAADLSPSNEPDRVVFGPLEKIDGQVIKTPQVKPEDLAPTKSDTETLKDKVISLEKGLPEMTDDQVLSSYKIESDQLVLRGLAKKAGVKDYQDAKIDADFIKSIREGLGAKKKRNKADKAAIIAQIKAAETKDQVEELAKGSDDEEIQNAALEKIIEIGE